MDGWMGGWMDGCVGGWTRREKEEGRLEHKELPAKVVITAALTAEPTPGGAALTMSPRCQPAHPWPSPRARHCSRPFHGST